MKIINSLTASFLDMEQMDWVIFIIALLAHVVLAYQLIKSNDKSQNSTSWIMWLILEFVLLMTQVDTGDSYAILFGYCSGSLTITLILVIKKQVSFKKEDLKQDIKYVLLATICCIVWKFADTYWSVICSTLAVATASLPQLEKMWKKPTLSDLLPYFGFWVAGTLTLISTDNIWTVPEKFFPVISMATSTLLLLPLVIKFISKLRYHGYLGVRCKKNIENSPTLE